MVLNTSYFLYYNFGLIDADINVWKYIEFGSKHKSDVLILIGQSDFNKTLFEWCYLALFSSVLNKKTEPA